MIGKAARLVIIAAIAVLLLVAAAGFFINLYRDSIALEVARSALRGSDVKVSDVRVESIGSNAVRFDAIVLELADGGTVFIEGITLPVRFSGLRDNELHVDALRFLPGTGETGPPRLAQSLQSILDAPAAAPGATIEIDEVVLPGMPAIRDFAWHADPLNPTLRATVEGFELFATTTEESDGTFRGSVRALLPDDTEALLLAFRLTPGDSGFRVHGDIGLMLEPMLPALRAVGAVPEQVAALTATLGGTFEFYLPADETRDIAVAATVTATADTKLTYHGGDTALELSVIEASPVAATFEYPSLDWTVQLDNALVRIGAADLDLPPVRLRNSRCRSGIRCTTALDLSYRNLAIGELTVDRVTAVAEAVEFVSLEDAWRASSPDTRITLKNASVAGHRVVAPAIAADLSYAKERVSGTARLTTPEGGLSGQATFSHDLASAAGKMTLQSAALDFTALNLSGFVTDWPYRFDVTAGRVTAEADVDWFMKDTGFAYKAAAQVNAESLAGRYADTGFVGAGTRLDVALDSTRQLEVKPARFDIALVDIGLPVENISGTAAPDIGESAVAVSSLSMSLLGGTVTAEPFRYDLDAESNQLMLRARGIQLPLMAALADLEAVTVSGGVSGKIPVTIRGNKVIIDGGYLENDPPGGVIRYRGGAADAVVDDGSQLGIVTRTLRNFEFESLTSAVDYSEAGDLLLTMRLKGINPDVDPTQPVILNLNVENNVPQMLRSLQATRSIEEVLEERLAK